MDMKQPPLLLTLAFVTLLGLLHMQAQSTAEDGALARNLAGILVLVAGTCLFVGSLKSKDPGDADDEREDLAA